MWKKRKINLYSDTFDGILLRCFRSIEEIRLEKRSARKKASVVYRFRVAPLHTGSVISIHDDGPTRTIVYTRCRTISVGESSRCCSSLSWRYQFRYTDRWRRRNRENKRCSTADDGCRRDDDDDDMPSEHEQYATVLLFPAGGGCVSKRSNVGPSLIKRRFVVIPISRAPETTTTTAAARDERVSSTSRACMLRYRCEIDIAASKPSTLHRRTTRDADGRVKWVQRHTVIIIILHLYRRTVVPSGVFRGGCPGG